MSMGIELPARLYGRRVLLGTATGRQGKPVQAFSPFWLSTFDSMPEALKFSYIEWHISMVVEVLDARGADTSRIEWATKSPTELMETIGGTP